VDSFKPFARYFNVYVCQPIDVVYEDGEVKELYALKLNGGEMLDIKRSKEILSLLSELYNNIDDDFVEIYNEELRAKDNKRRYINSKVEKETQPKYLYLVKADKYYKIGITKSPVSRLSDLMTLPPFEGEVLKCVMVDKAEDREKYLHKKYDDKRVNGEWFVLSDREIENTLKYIDLHALELE
jgi:predicted DNA-binding antitoxin AbrB/MazE fold protein